MVKERLEDMEISIQNMIWSVCMKWKSIIVVGILFAVLMGGVSYYRSWRQIEQQRKEMESPQKSEDIILSEDLSENVKVYIEYLEKFERQMKYNTHSALTRIDPNGFYKGEISYLINAHYEVEYPLIEKHDPTQDITVGYQAVASKKEVIDRIAQIAGLEDEDAAYATEMIDVNNRYGAMNGIKTDLLNGVLSFGVYADNEKTCQLILECLEDAIVNEQSEITKKYGRHELVLNASNVFFTTDSMMLSYQRELQDRMRDYTTRMGELEKNLKDDEKKYIEAYKKEMSLAESEDVEKKNTTEALVSKARISKKWVAAGMAVGMALMLGAYALFYIIGGKMRVEDDVEDIFGFNVLGTVIEEQKKYHGIDALFAKALYRGVHLFEKEDAMEMALANIRVFARKMNVERVYVVGATSNEKEKKFCEDLAGKLKKNGIEITYGRNILYDASSLEEAAKIGCVIVICAPEVSTYEEVARELDQCIQQKTDVMGLMVVA